jgi:uncharacterized protein
MPDTNPFNFGDLALDQAFTDRDAELAELTSDVRNGQNVVIFAPRRYGKTSLVWRAAQRLEHQGVLTAQLDLMRTASKEQFAAKLAEAINEQIATPLLTVREKALQIFRGLRVIPTMTLDPITGAVSFSFTAGYSDEDIDATIERLLELPGQLATERGRRVALVFDEFQQILEIDKRLPALMRAVFQEQPDVAHVYLGSKRSMMARLFNDENEPFWRSAKQIELQVISPEAFAPFIRDRFASTGRSIDDATLGELLEITGGHPYATQELSYALWELTAPGARVDRDDLSDALAQVLRSENAHFTQIWGKATNVQRQILQALATDTSGAFFSTEYARRHGLPARASLQRGVGKLVEDELVRHLGPGRYRIAEPFLDEWVRRYAS